MKKLVVGAVVAGGLVLGLRVAVRHCRTMMSEHCGSSADQNCPCT